MLLDPTGSPYDINFRLFRTYVRVHISFWIFTAILGWDWVKAGFGFLILWIVCVFVSILLHEFGHVWAGKLFGTEGDILLYSFGGLAIGASDLRNRWQRVAVYLAGPGIQLALYGLLYAYLRYAQTDWLEEHKWLARAIGMMLIINWFWPLFNLLPVFPLDGGQVMRELCEAASPSNGRRVALMISIGVAAGIAINALLAANGQKHIPYLPGSMYAVILFAMLAFESYQLLQNEQRW